SPRHVREARAVIQNEKPLSRMHMIDSVIGSGTLSHRECSRGRFQHPACNLRDWILGPTGQSIVEKGGYVAVNCLTSGYPEGATLPVHLDSDREVIDAALVLLGTRASQDARILHIRNTLAVEEVSTTGRSTSGSPPISTGCRSRRSG